MARPLRIEFPGALYHVTTRGNARADIFLEDRDRHDFLDVLGSVTRHHHWLCRAYCLMTNHYHLLVETPEPNLSRGMRQLNGRYTQRFDRRHRRAGHLFQGRFNGILVERESHLLELARYVVLNPVRAGLVQSAEDYPWSSLQATLGLAPAPDWLAAGEMLATFGSIRRYGEFVREGAAGRSPLSAVRGVVLGSDAFLASLRPRLGETAGQREIPRRERLAHRPSLEALLPSRLLAERDVRDDRIREASRVQGYSLAEIGRQVGLHYSTVSRIVAAQPRAGAVREFKT
jgi:REP element-mobilizing transposase RayT